MPLSHRERFQVSLEFEEPDVVPITDLALDPPIVEAILGKKLGGFSIIAASADDPWESAHRNRVALSEACVKLGFDAIPAISDYALCKRDYTPRFIGKDRFVDEWGRIIESRPDTKTSWWIGSILETEEDVENYVAPDPEDEGRFEIARRTIEPFKDKDVIIMGQAHSCWHMAFQARGGIDKLLLDMYRRPTLAKRFCDKISDTCFGMAKLIIEGGVEVLFVTDDYADCHSTFMSPSLFGKFELPYLKRVIEYAEKRGIPVFKHSDGNLYPILDDLIAAGIKGLHPMEPGAMDIADVKKRYGEKICILGNVDCKYVLPYGSEEDVRKDVRRCIDAAAKGGGYILESSNSIHANCKVQNIYTMVDEARKYGKYPILKGNR